MIIGIGIDVVDIARFNKTLTNPRFKLKYFSSSEIGLSNESLAGRFAAREALYKALDKQEFFNLKNIEIINAHNGKPKFVFQGELKGYDFDKNFYLSITHCPEFAAAIVVIESKSA
jgi:holo-[acyl-carrier protein] synthase